MIIFFAAFGITLVLSLLASNMVKSRFAKESTSAHAIWLRCRNCPDDPA